MNKFTYQILYDKTRFNVVNRLVQILDFLDFKIDFKILLVKKLVNLVENSEKLEFYLSYTFTVSQLSRQLGIVHLKLISKQNDLVY